MRTIAALLLMVSGAAAGDLPHWEARDWIIALQTQIPGAGATLLWGDSNRERMWWNDVGNCWVINAGYGDITSSGFAGSRIRNLLSIVKPRISIGMIGTNNQATTQSDLDQYGADLRDIIAAHAAADSSLTLYSILPFDKFTFTQSDVVLAQTGVNRLNSVLVETAQATGTPWVNLNSSFMDLVPGSPTHGYAIPGKLGIDGIHLSRQGSVDLYYIDANAIAAAVAARQESRCYPQ